MFYGSAKIEWKIKEYVMENKGSVVKMIKMRGTNSMLASKLHFCSIPQLHVDRFVWDFYNMDSFDETIKMKDNNPMLTSKVHVYTLAKWT